MNDNPFIANLPIEEQIENVRAALNTAHAALTALGKTEHDALALLALNLGRKARPHWHDLAWEVVSARAQLAELEEQASENERHDKRRTVEPQLKQVVWSNVWNWTHSGGHGSRVHLTYDATLAGKTLCGKEFPRAKGHPIAVWVCKGCLKKAGITVKDMNKLPFVESSFD